MDGPRNCHTNWSKLGRERQLSYDHLYVESKKKGYKWTYLQSRNRVKVIENKLMFTKVWDKDKLKGWDWQIHAIIYKLDD